MHFNDPTTQRKIIRNNVEHSRSLIGNPKKQKCSIFGPKFQILRKIEPCQFFYL